MKKRIILVLTLMIVCLSFISAQTRLELTIENLPDKVEVGEIFTLDLNINTDAKYEIKEVTPLHPSIENNLLEVLSIDGLQAVVKAVAEGVEAINFTVTAAYFFPDDVVQGRMIGLTTNTKPITIVSGAHGPLKLVVENLPETVDVGDRFTLNLKIDTDVKYEIREVIAIQPPIRSRLLRVLAINGLEVIVEAIKEGVEAINFSVTAAYYFTDDVTQPRIIELTTNEEPITIISNDMVCGDVTSDGTADIIDGLLIAQYYVGLIDTLANPSVADVNGDSIINIIDALLVIQYYVGYDIELNCSGN